MTKQIVQRFACYTDFEKHQCTIEGREEYEPLVNQGIVVYAGFEGSHSANRQAFQKI